MEREKKSNKVLHDIDAKRLIKTCLTLFSSGESLGCVPVPELQSHQFSPFLPVSQDKPEPSFVQGFKRETSLFVLTGGLKR